MAEKVTFESGEGPQLGGYRSPLSRGRFRGKWGVFLNLERSSSHFLGQPLYKRILFFMNELRKLILVSFCSILEHQRANASGTGM